MRPDKLKNEERERERRGEILALRYLQKDVGEEKRREKEENGFEQKYDPPLPLNMETSRTRRE